MRSNLVLAAAAAMSALATGSAFLSPLVPGRRTGTTYSQQRIGACAQDATYRLTVAGRSGRGRCTLGAMAMAEDDSVGGGEMPTRLVGGGEMPTRPVMLKKKKQIPMHVQDMLRQTSTRENPIEDLMRLDDFKGLGGGDMAASKTMNEELYVKGLPFDLDTDAVRKLFLQAGHRPKSVRVLKDRKDNTRSLGFGFVSFKTAKDADAAMKTLHGMALKSGAKGESTTKLSISKASAKGKERKMASRTKKTDFQHEVDIRKMQLSFDSKNKAVTSLDRMPRAYRVMADKNAKVLLLLPLLLLLLLLLLLRCRGPPALLLVLLCQCALLTRADIRCCCFVQTKRELSEELAKGAELDEDATADIGDNRAQAALDMFLKEVCRLYVLCLCLCLCLCLYLCLCLSVSMSMSVSVCLCMSSVFCPCLCLCPRLFLCPCLCLCLCLCLCFRLCTGVCVCDNREEF